MRLRPPPPPPEPPPRPPEPPWHCQDNMDRVRPAPSPVHAFYHMACMNEWKPIFHEQLEEFHKADLHPTTYVLGSEADQEYVAKYLPVAGWQHNFGWYETPTLDTVYQWCRQNPTGAAIYCHSKGVTRPWDGVKALWRRKMSGHIIAPWRDHIERLTEYDTCGVYFNTHKWHSHYAGNFWIARADWISHLPPPWEHRREPRRGWLRGERFHAEIWLFSRTHYRAYVVPAGFLE